MLFSVYSESRELPKYITVLVPYTLEMLVDPVHFGMEPDPPFRDGRFWIRIRLNMNFTSEYNDWTFITQPK